ncbi:vacuolar transporter chaperone [Raphidocelis subcapitata]|uniref:Vacuolar transporter chaperone n=1 Tax=Raphidocelis subcapitata TaxID=307507 RepID=A0A2V0PNY0_9CHLO|nr:vacuolar transporter chaperone [Raphidocelis subcapitata]|eukprot:GBF99690.1 vacuolar transporter chaperone [Raphidocelis subcapitata]
MAAAAPPPPRPTPAAAPSGARACPVWAAAADDAAQAAGSRPEAHVWFLGPRGAGKSTLIQRVLYPNRVEPPPPSDALEYTFVRRSGGGDAAGGPADIAQFWEAGGQEGVALAVMGARHTFLTPKTVASAVLVVALDLSDPAGLLPAAAQWLGAARSKLAQTYEAFERKGVALPEQLRQRARQRFGAGHEDLPAIDVAGIPLVIAATKWDVFSTRDAEEQRVVAAALRCLAHAHGAHLVYLGGLQPGGGAGSEGVRAGAGIATNTNAARQQAAALEGFARLIQHLAFVGMDSKLPPKLQQPCLDHLGLLWVPAGSDRLQAIGLPNGSAAKAKASTPAEMTRCLEAWGAAVSALCPASAGQAKRGGGSQAAAAAAQRLVSDARYSEEEVDRARQSSAEAVAAYYSGGGSAAAEAPAASDGVRLRASGGVQEALLLRLLDAEIANAGARAARGDALSAALRRIRGADEDALASVVGRGPGGRGAAPRVLALALLARAAAGEGDGRRRSTSSAAASPFAALAGGGAFAAAYEGELMRVAAGLAAAQDELLARLADLGAHLPPAAAADCPEPPAPSPEAAAEAAAAELPECARLRAAADAVAEDLIALDDGQRAAVAALAALAAAHDDALLAAAAGAEGPAGGDDSRHTTEGGCEVAAAAATAEAAAAGACEAARLERQRLQRLQAAGPVPLTAVCSHSAPAPAAKYTAGVLPDVYHSTVHRLLTADGAASSQPALWALSVLHARIRHREAAARRAAAAAARPAEWKAPDTFSRATTKYWVRPAHVARVKAALCRHLPLLVYGATCPVASGDVASVPAIRAGAKAATSLVSSVYLDTPSLEVYRARLARDDGARATRLRWYGVRRPSDAGQPIFVERKTHREPWTGENSVKERACLRQGDVRAFLEGGLPAGVLGSSSQRQLLAQVQEHVVSLGQAPSLRTEYVRSAWQHYSSNDLRVSLDEDMLLLRERGRHATPGDWCAALEAAGPLPGGDALRFPYAVLEIKLAAGRRPRWVKELLASGLLVEVAAFSKFLHGSALLFPAAAAATAPPSWFLPVAAGQVLPATVDEVAAGATAAAAGAAAAGATAAGALSAVSSDDGSCTSSEAQTAAGIKIRKRIPAPSWLQPAAPPLNGGALLCCINGDATAAATATAATAAEDQPARPRSGSGAAWKRLLFAARLGERTDCAGKPPAQPPSPTFHLTARAAADLQRPPSQPGAPAPGSGAQPPEQELARLQLPAADAPLADTPAAVAPSSPDLTISIAELLASTPLLAAGRKKLAGVPGSPLAGRRAELIPAMAVASGGGRGGGGGDGSGADGASGKWGGDAAEPGQRTPSGTTPRGRGAALARKLRLSGFLRGGRGGGSSGSSSSSGSGGGAAYVVIAPPVPAAAKGSPRLSCRLALNDHLLGFAGRAPRSPQLLLLQKQRLREAALEEGGRGGGGEAGQQARERVRIEPKTYFANERTFLQWVNIGVLVMMTGLGLLTGASITSPANGTCWATPTCRAARVSGAVIAPISVLLLAYALWMYRRRAGLIARRETVRYDDRAGPTVLTLLLVGVIVIAIVLAASSLGGW